MRKDECKKVKNVKKREVYIFQRRCIWFLWRHADGFGLFSITCH